MNKAGFNKIEQEWFDIKPKNFRFPESEKLEMDALSRERDIVDSKNNLLSFLNDYSNEIPEKLMSGPEAIRIGKGNSKYRPNYFQAVYVELDELNNLGMLSKDFDDKYDDFSVRFNARRPQGVKTRTTKEEIDAMDNLIKLALKELEDKGY